jgi:hypothetical protein
MPLALHQAQGRIIVLNGRFDWSRDLVDLSCNQAVRLLKAAGIMALLADGFPAEFCRQALKVDLPVFTFALAREIETDDPLQIDLTFASLSNLNTGRRYCLPPRE